MTKFTFFLDDDSIHEIKAVDANSAMRKICASLFCSWVEMQPRVLACLSHGGEVLP